MAASTLLTDEEFLRLADKHYHNALGSWIVSLLRSVLDGSRVFRGDAYRLGPRTWLIPDVSVTHPNQPLEDWFIGAPMLAVEIVSADDDAVELDEKVGTYLSHGSAEVWIIYPTTHVLMVFRPDGVVRVPDGVDYQCSLFGVTVTPEFRTLKPR